MIIDFVAKLADYNFGEYLETEVDRAKAEGRAEAVGRRIDPRPMALTESGHEPAGLALESILGDLRKTHPLGTRIRFSVEVL